MNKKLYAIKNDEVKYWEFGDINDFCDLGSVSCPATNSKKQAGLLAFVNGGHVVTLIEEPEKVVLTKEQAEIVEKARVSDFPGSYISSRLLMNAYVNGYTVAKDNKYNVKVPHSRFYYWKWKDDEIGVGSGEDDDVRGVEPYRFTDAEIEHYGLQDCEKVVVTDYAKTTWEEDYD